MSFQCKGCKQSYDHSPKRKQATKRHNRLQHTKQRLTALQYYGGPDPQCACCGMDRFEFLTLDHINGGGADHRRKFRGPMASWLLKHNFPPEYELQVLCYNCNNAKAYYGHCPHQPR